MYRVFVGVAVADGAMLDVTVAVLVGVCDIVFVGEGVAEAVAVWVAVGV